MPALIRRARPGDGELLASLNRFVHDLHVEARPDYFMPTRAEETAAWFEAHLAASEARVFIADLDAQPIGYALAFFQARGPSPFGAGRRWCELDQIAVDPCWRQQGVARALVDAIVHEAVTAGIDELKANTWAFNGDALRSFESLGLVVESVRLRRRAPLLE